MIPPLASIRSLPHGQLLQVVRDTLLAEAERIRQSQDALLAAKMIGAWSDERAGAHHALKATADVLQHFLAEGQTVQAWNRDPTKKKRALSAEFVSVSDHLRTTIIHEFESQLGIRPREGADAA